MNADSRKACDNFIEKEKSRLKKDAADLGRRCLYEDLDDFSSCARYLLATSKDLHHFKLTMTEMYVRFMETLEKLPT